MKIRRRILVAGLILAAVHWLFGDGPRYVVHHFALFHPGEAQPFQVTSARVAFENLYPPFAVGERLLLLGAKRGMCSAIGRQDPLIVYSIDPTTGALTELAGEGAPLARMKARIAPVEDGFVMLAGYQAEGDWACIKDSYFADLFGVQAPESDRKLVRETYRYRLSAGRWERVPQLDIAPTPETQSPDEPFSGEEMIAVDNAECLPSKDFEIGTDTFLPMFLAVGVSNFYDVVAPQRIAIPPLSPELSNQLAGECEWLRPQVMDRKLFLYFSKRPSAQRKGTARHAGAVFDLATQRWSPITGAGAPAEAVDGQFYGQLAALQHKLLVLSADVREPSRSYDYLTSRWTPIAQVGAPRGPSVIVAVVDDRLIASGQLEGNSTLFYYFPAEDRWEHLPDPSDSRFEWARRVGSQLFLGNYSAGLFGWIDLNTAKFIHVSPPTGFANYRITNSSHALLFHATEPRPE